MYLKYSAYKHYLERQKNAEGSSQKIHLFSVSQKAIVCKLYNIEITTLVYFLLELLIVF